MIMRPVAQSPADTVIQHGTRTREFSIKGGYTCMAQWAGNSSSRGFSILENGEDPLESENTNRWKLLYWKVFQGTLPLGINNRKRHLGSDFSHRLCQLAEITFVHLLQNCPVTSHIWLASSFGIRSRTGEGAITEMVTKLVSLFVQDASGRLWDAELVYSFTLGYLVWRNKFFLIFFYES